jgi:hypothetical protein
VALTVAWPWATLANSVAIGAAASACAPSRAVPSSAGDASAATLQVPRAPGAVTLDGDNDDPGWTRAPGPARTGPFVAADGAPARPYSDARLLWGDGYLYMLLYAADDDIRTGEDGFRVHLSRAGVEYTVEVSAGGVVRAAARDAHGVLDPAWRSGAHVSRELDGTPDDDRDADEEWSLELAVPLASLGMRGRPGEAADFAVQRCDVSTGRAPVSSHWGAGGRERGRLVLD